MVQILINIGYLFMLSAMTVRDILWLRVLLVTAQLTLFSYGILVDNLNVAFWNLLFLSINTFQIIRLIRERRPIELPPDQLDLYQKIFSGMRRREFLYLWHMGNVTVAEDVQLIKADTRQDKLFLVLEGQVRVVRDGKLITHLKRGSFIAEMSFLTGNPATADVFADGWVRYLFWEQDKLRDLQKMNQALLIKFQNILGKDLTEKIKAGTKKQIAIQTGAK